MKLFLVLSHPYTLLICYFLMLISGEHWGGFYLLYILIALPFGGVHALLALCGVVVILISYHKVKKHELTTRILNCTGVLLLAASLFYFFYNDRQHYNWGTFDEVIPLLTVIITGGIAVCFLIRTFLGKTLLKKGFSVVGF